jgi:hypothetical protein
MEPISEKDARELLDELYKQFFNFTKDDINSTIVIWKSKGWVKKNREEEIMKELEGLSYGKDTSDVLKSDKLKTELIKILYKKIERLEKGGIIK